MPTNKKSIIEDLNGAGKQHQPETTPPATPKAPLQAPLHHANMALQGLSSRQAEVDAINDAKTYAMTYSQVYAIELLRQKAEFLQSFHNQSSQSLEAARQASLQDANENFFNSNQELESMIAQMNAYTPPALPAPSYNLLPPSLG